MRAVARSRALTGIGGLVVAIGLCVVLAAEAPAAMKTVRFVAKGDKGPVVFFKAGGMKLRGRCNGAVDDLSVIAKTTKEGALIHGTGQSGGDVNSYTEQDPFQPGDVVDAIAGPDDDSAGQLIYAQRNAGTIVAIDYLAEEGEAYDGTYSCAFAGTARIVKKGATDHLRFVADGDAARGVFKRAGLRLTGRCVGGELEVEVETGREDAVIHVNAQGMNAPIATYYEDDNFDPVVDDFDVATALGGDTNRAGQLVYVAEPNGKVVSIDWVLEEGAFLPSRDCAFAGVARVAGKGDKRRVRRVGNYGTVGGGTFLKSGGLILFGGCGGMPQQLSITHSTTKANPSIHTNSQSLGPTDDYGESDGLSVGTFHSLSGLLGIPMDSSIGQEVYSRRDGVNVSVDWLAEEDDAWASRKDCAFLGIAERAKP